MAKVRLEAIKPWIGQRITEILGFDDEVLVEFCSNQLETRVCAFLVYFLLLHTLTQLLIFLVASSMRCPHFFQYPDAKMIQINLSGFLNAKNARMFMSELWAMLDSAQQNAVGIPQLIDVKKKALGLDLTSPLLDPALFIPLPSPAPAVCCFSFYFIPSSFFTPFARSFLLFFLRRSLLLRSYLSFVTCSIYLGRILRFGVR